MAMGKKNPKRRRASGATQHTAAGSSQRHHDWTLLGTYLLILLPPFVFIRGIADSFRLPKLVMISTLALLAVALLLLRLVGRGRSEAASAPWRGAMLPFVAPLLIVSVIGLWTSDHPGVVARTLPTLWAGGAFLLAATTLLDSADRQRLLRLLMWPACGLAAIGLLQGTGLWQPMNFEDAVSERLAVTSLAGGAFDLAAFLLLPLLWCQHRIWTTRGTSRGWRRWLRYGVLVLLSAALLATQTLGVLVAAVAASGVLWLLQLRSAGVSKRRLALVLGTLSVLVVVAVVAVAPLRQRVTSKVREISQGEINVFLTGRLDGWRAGLWMFRQEPVTGVGTGVYSREFGDARLALQDEGVEFWLLHRQPYFANAHNDVIEALAEWGALGGIALAWLLLGLGRQLRRRPAAGDESGERLEFGFVLASLVAMAIVSLTNFPWHLALVAFPWLLVVAEIFDTGDSATESQSDSASDSVPQSASRSASPSQTVPKAAVWGLVVLTLAACGLVFLHGKDRLGAQILVRTAESLALEGGRRGQVPPRLLDLGLDMLRRAEELDPSLVSVKITRGGLFMVAGRMEAAERTYQEALAMQNRAEIWVNLARLRLRQGDAQGARDAARMAVALGASKRQDLPEFRDMLMQDNEAS